MYIHLKNSLKNRIKTDCVLIIGRILKKILKFESYSEHYFRSIKNLSS